MASPVQSNDTEKRQGPSITRSLPVQDGFCGYPWVKDPFSTHEPRFYCANANRSSCHRNTFNFKALCQWSNGTNCTAVPVDSDIYGVCAGLDTKEKCTYHSFYVKGSCFWHDPSAISSSLNWCESIGLEFNTGTAWSGYQQLTCNDVIGYDLNREEMLLDSTKAGIVTTIEENCCVQNNNNYNEVPTLHPSSILGHVNFPSYSTEAPTPTLTPTLLKQDTPSTATPIAGTSADKSSGLILVASAPLIGVLVSYFWKNRRKMLSSRDQGSKQILDDPSQFDHIAPPIQQKQQDPPLYEDTSHTTVLENTDLVALAPFVLGLVSYFWTIHCRIFSSRHTSDEQIRTDPSQLDCVAPSELEPGSAQFQCGLPPGLESLDPSQFEIIEPC